MTIIDKKRSMAIRVVVYIAGLFFVALAVRLALVADLGQSPGTSFALCLWKMFGLSLAVWIYIINIVVVLAQVAILRKNFKLYSLLQLVFTFIFMLFIAYLDPLVAWWIPTGYFVRFVQLVISIALTGLGIFCVVKAGLIPMPPECLILAVQTKLRGSVGKFRTIYDCLCLVFAVLLGLIHILGQGGFDLVGLLEFAGIREGTVLTAVFGGVFVIIFDKLIGKPLGRLCFGADHGEPARGRVITT